MTKPRKTAAIILAVILLIAVILCAKPVAEHIAYKLRYHVWEGHMERAGDAFWIQADYETAYKEASAAYDSLKTETPVDIGLKASTCLFLADVLESRGEDDELLSVLERGYADTEDGAIYERLAVCPVSFVNKNIQALICESVGVAEDALTYADLQKVDEISISGNSVSIMPGEIKGTYRNTKFVTIVYGSERFAAELSRCRNAKVTVATGVPADGDLSNLQNIKNLHTLYIHNSTVSDISALSGITSLRELYLYDNQITDLSPLAALTQLTTLRIENNPITDLSPLSVMTELEALNISNLRPKSFLPLAFMTKLRKLNADYTGFSDLSVLADHNMLESLHLRGNGISDITSLSGKPYLQTLYLNDNAVTDLTPLTDSIDLNWLVCNQNRIEDISALAGCTEMETLGLADNPITDLSAVSGMTKLHSISISDTQITDLSSLSGLANLYSVGAEHLAVTDWSPVFHVWDVSGRPESETPKE